MVRQLDVQMIVPQHGAPFQGKAIIEEFLQWVEQLECGIDNLQQVHYQIP
jgi:flavorubredoxin